MITPVVEEGQINVIGYFPAANWYDYKDGTPFELEQDSKGIYHTKGEYKKLKPDIDQIPLHVRGGYIIPTQESANTTHYSRQKPFGIIVAPDGQGTLYNKFYKMFNPNLSFFIDS